jgi:hypothetical protein
LATSVWPCPTKYFLWLRHWLVPCTHGVPYGMVACGRCARNCLAGMACGCMDDLVATCNKVSGQVNKVSLATLWWCCPIRTTGDLGHGRPVRRTCVAWRGMARQGRTPVQTKRVCHTDGIGVVQILETFMLQNISLGVISSDSSYFPSVLSSQPQRLRTWGRLPREDRVPNGRFPHDPNVHRGCVRGEFFFPDTVYKYPCDQ